MSFKAVGNITIYYYYRFCSTSPKPQPKSLPAHNELMWHLLTSHNFTTSSPSNLKGTLELYYEVPKQSYIVHFMAAQQHQHMLQQSIKLLHHECTTLQLTVAASCNSTATIHIVNFNATWNSSMSQQQYISKYQLTLDKPANACIKWRSNP